MILKQLWLRINLIITTQLHYRATIDQQQVVSLIAYKQLHNV